MKEKEGERQTELRDKRTATTAEAETTRPSSPPSQNFSLKWLHSFILPSLLSWPQRLPSSRVCYNSKEVCHCNQLVSDYNHDCNHWYGKIQRDKRRPRNERASQPTYFFSITPEYPNVYVHKGLVSYWFFTFPFCLSSQTPLFLFFFSMFSCFSLEGKAAEEGGGKEKEM